jgi:diaminopimelate decarboxylase
MGLPNPGIEAYVQEIRHAKTVLPVPLIVSVYGFSTQEYAITAKKAAEAGADAVELNVSCPHVKETGSEIGQNPEILTKVVKKVKAKVHKPVFVKLSPNVTDIVEIAEAAVKAGADALTAVNTVKTTPFKKFAGVDAGFNTLVRPTMYGSYHPVLVANKLGSSEEETYDVVGPICESGDALARDRRLPKIEEGDLLAVLNAGAYGFAMSSQYNARPRATEILVKNGKYTLVRERETFDDLLSGQRVAEWLK